MTDHYLYLDESGTLDFEARPGEAFFGVGTAHFVGDHRDSIWAGHQLRIELEAKGIRLPKGLHAKNDSHPTRREVYQTLAAQPVRFNATMLRKAKAIPRIQAAGKVRLYQMALWLHLKFVVFEISSPGDRVFVVAGHLQTSRRREAIRHAVEDVCRQTSFDRDVVPCIWEAQSSWGIRAVDYALWAVQRRAEGKTVPDYCDVISPQQASTFMAWGT